MGSYLAHRLLACLPVLLLASLVVFGAMRLLPGDPIDALYPAEASVSAEAKSRLRGELGLGEPLPVQYLRWLAKSARGDLGSSVRARQPVLDLVMTRAQATARLVLFSTLLALLIAIPAGVLAAHRRGGVVDAGVSALALLGLSIPGFALGTLLALIFGVWLRWTPTAGDLVLPVVVQGIGGAGILVRGVRSGVLDQLGRDYVRTARGKGLATLGIQVWHVAPNALAVTVSVLATVVGYQLGGAIVIEQLFAWPGVGSLLFESISGRDYAVVQGIALFMALTYLLVNLIADLARAALDPRLRERRGAGGTS